MIDWNKVRYFSSEEFPENPDDYAAPELLYTLDDFREYIGSSITPSPVSGALARLGGSKTSRHYAIGRKSTAVDLFFATDIRSAFMKALSFGRWGGIGLYRSAKYAHRTGMLHVDLRGMPKGGPTLWCRDADGRYWYPARGGEHADRFFKQLGL